MTKSWTPGNLQTSQDQQNVSLYTVRYISNT